MTDQRKKCMVCGATPAGYLGGIVSLCSTHKKMRPKVVTEQQVRKRFENIINGKGLTIPRLAVEIAVDSLFEDPD